MPKCTKKITITKSPMAHKTFSQEQLKWEYYKIVIPYKIILNEKVSSLESFLFFILQHRNSNNKMVSLGTNLINLKRVKMRYFLNEKKGYLKLN